MKSFEFTLVLGDKNELSDALEDRVFEVGCDDATLSCRNGIVYLDFEREASSFQAAVISAIQQLENYIIPVRVERIEADDQETSNDQAVQIIQDIADINQLLYGRQDVNVNDRLKGLEKLLATV